MNDPIKNGGAGAYPQATEFTADDGLTKRELLAAMAMQGFCTNYMGHTWDLDRCAEESVRAADKLLSELSKPQEDTP